MKVKLLFKFINRNENSSEFVTYSYSKSDECTFDLLTIFACIWNTRGLAV